jgi:hypothetical protein
MGGILQQNSGYQGRGNTHKAKGLIMKTNAEIKKLVNEVFKNDSPAEKKKLIKLLSVENRINRLKHHISIQENMLNITEPLAKTEVERKNKSIGAREFKKRIIKEALRMIFAEKPGIKKTLNPVWKEFHLLKDRDVCDPLTGIKVKIYKKGDTLFIETANQKKPLYKKESIQRYIDPLK